MWLFFFFNGGACNKTSPVEFETFSLHDNFWWYVFFLFVNVYWDFFAKKICMIKNNLFKSHCVGYLCWDFFFFQRKKIYIKLRRVDFRLGLGASCLMLWSHDIFTTHFQLKKNWLEWNANKVQFDRSIKKNGYESERG